VTGSLYRDVVGSIAWDALPRVLHDLHEHGGDGTLTVTSRGLARVLSFLGFAPSPGTAAVTLRIEKTDNGERWVRRFHDEVFATEQRPARGVIAERFGILEIEFKVAARGVTLQYEMLGARILGLTIPPWMRPRVEASERADGPRVGVNVAIGKRFRYSGFLTPR